MTQDNMNENYMRSRSIRSLKGRRSISHHVRHQLMIKTTATAVSSFPFSISSGQNHFNLISNLADCGILIYVVFKINLKLYRLCLAELKQKIQTAVATVDISMLKRSWIKFGYRLDIDHARKGSHVELYKGSRKKN
ncbi:hypothetical protein NPIL_522251 [Nephila pilipes]|uniref:Uncharacterized protein n=1 Tax=Nephila pilipes TaxID=299642 RepID=A0A8X6P508_NEPPI|nr:hypothetical protein NPIL_522251 [Nephila pilipes]